MRRITAWILGTGAGLVLLFSYHTSTMGPSAPHPAAGGSVALPAPPAATSPTTVPAAWAAGGTPPPGGTATPSGGVSSTTGPSTADTVVSGPTVPTRRGPVQVQIRIHNGRLVDVAAPVLPDANFRDVRINDYAVPILRQEALDAQSANIDTVSGATVTSDGYIQSLQAALDSARFSQP
jgi:uncharacterized protein with FMN-binding domain